MNAINDLTKKQIYEYFLNKYVYLLNSKNTMHINAIDFIASDTKEKITLEKYSYSCDFTINKGNIKIRKTFFDDGIVIKEHFKGNKRHCLNGPAYIEIDSQKKITSYYFIEGNDYTRKNFNSFIRKTLNTTNFNRFRSISKLEQMIPVLEHYNRVAQLEALNKRLNYLKVIEELEK